MMMTATCHNLPKLLLLCSFLVPTWGCRQSAPPQSGVDRTGDVSSLKSKVIAQGQILPSGGFIRLAGKPGDIVDEVLVTSGDKVQAQAPLVKLRSESINAGQLAVLEARRAEASRTRDNTILTAQQNVKAAQLKLDHLSGQQVSLARKSELLNLAREQVAATQKVLKQLQSIAADAVTGEFVGQIEIDRQQVSVSQADLNFRQQEEAHAQAAQDLEFASLAAQAEMDAAQAVLAAAEASQALQVIDLEIKALKLTSAAAEVLAPTDGIIFAVNVRPGEAVTTFPLIEMASTKELVCEVEVNEMDAAAIAQGQPVKIYSRAFGDAPLTGHVLKKSALIGRPQLRPLDPLARVDFRAVTAIITLDEASSEKAQDWLQLQVEVEIDISQ